MTTNTVKIKLVCDDEALDKAYANCNHWISEDHCVIAQEINDACIIKVSVSPSRIRHFFGILPPIDTPHRITDYICQFDEWLCGKGERPKPRNFILEVPKEWVKK